jgi:hypothetical protein
MHSSVVFQRQNEKKIEKKLQTLSLKDSHTAPIVQHTDRTSPHAGMPVTSASASLCAHRLALPPPPARHPLCSLRRSLLFIAPLVLMATAPEAVAPFPILIPRRPQDLPGGAREGSPCQR